MNDIRKNYIPKDVDRRKVPLWYVLYVRSRFEKKVAKELEERKIEYFLPLIPKLRYWKDRRKIVAMPLFPGYIFVHIKLADEVNVVSIDGVAWLISFLNKPVPIPESQITDVKKLLIYPERVENIDYIKDGCMVEIIYGPFIGIQGKLVEHRGKRRLVVGIDLINQALSVEVEMDQVKMIRNTPSPRPNLNIS